MVETVLDQDLSGLADGETDRGVQAPGGFAPPGTVALSAPPAGELVAIAVQAGQTLVFEPTVRGLGLEPSGDDLLIVFSGAGRIRLEGFAALADAAAPPRLVLPDGGEFGADRLLAWLADGQPDAPIETAAGAEAGGEAPASGGGNGYGENLGEVTVAGLDIAGALGPGAEPAGLASDGSDDPGPGLAVASLAIAESAPVPVGAPSPGGSEAGQGAGSENANAGAGSENANAGAGSENANAGAGSENANAGAGAGNANGGGGSGNANGGGGPANSQSNSDGPGLSGSDQLTGGNGADNLVGGANDDQLDGGKGNDDLNGASGDDILIGGLGDDDLQGGSGADVFLFDFDGGQEAPGDDIIRDFDPGDGDLLRFSDILDIDSDGADLDDFSAAVSSVQDNGKDVTIVLEDGGSLMLDGLGTGAIDSVNALLNEIGQNAVELV